MVRGLYLSLLPFFVFIAINLLFSYTAYIFLVRKSLQYIPIYAAFCPIPKPIFKILPFLFVCFSALLKLLVMLFFTKKALAIRNYSWPFLGIFVITDLVYVALQFLPSKIDWNFYYHSSSLLRLNLLFGYPNWFWFGLFGLFYTSLFKHLTKTSWGDLGIYFLFAVTSFSSSYWLPTFSLGSCFM